VDMDTVDMDTVDMDPVDIYPVDMDTCSAHESSGHGYSGHGSSGHRYSGYESSRHGYSGNRHFHDTVSFRTLTLSLTLKVIFVITFIVLHNNYFNCLYIKCVPLSYDLPYKLYELFICN